MQLEPLDVHHASVASQYFMDHSVSLIYIAHIHRPIQTSPTRTRDQYENDYHKRLFDFVSDHEKASQLRSFTLTSRYPCKVSSSKGHLGLEGERRLDETSCIGRVLRLLKRHAVHLRHFW
jgi:hypothetical protein